MANELVRDAGATALFGELLPRAVERVTGKLIYTTYFGFPPSGYFNAIVDIEEVM